MGKNKRPGRIANFLVYCLVSPKGVKKDPRLSPHYVLEVRREGPLDSLTVIVEGRAGAAESALTEAGEDLRHHIKNRIGVTATVTVVAEGGVERSMGKAKRIIDLRPKD